MRKKIFMIRRDAEAALGISRSTIYLGMQIDALAKPIRTGPRAVRWQRAEIVAWLEQVSSRLWESMTALLNKRNHHAY